MDHPLYTTPHGRAYLGDALDGLQCLEDESVDLVMTSPPFALQREKSYGNVDQESYVEWLLVFCQQVHRVLRPKGSFVLDLGGAYQKGRPVRSLYNYRLLIKLCDDLDFRLAEEFFWHNPAKLPSPIEWVNKRKLRAKDSVDTIWWLSKEDNPKADVTRVLVPYSDRMKKLQSDPGRYYVPKLRPSGHDIGKSFAADNGGAIPSNLLQIANTESNSQYIKYCKAVEAPVHPARFPQKLPAFFVNFLTEPGDLVLDIFAGSNTTGAAAEAVGRRWVAFEQSRPYLAASAFRFAPPDLPAETLRPLYDALMSGKPALYLPASAALNMGLFAEI